MGSRVLDGERSDGLKLAAVVELEILFFQVGDDFAVRVPYDNAHQHIVDAHFKGCGSVLRGNFLPFTRRSFLRGLGGRIRTRGRRVSGWRKVLRRRILRKERPGGGCKGQETAGQKSRKDMLRSQ